MKRSSLPAEHRNAAKCPKTLSSFLQSFFIKLKWENTQPYQLLTPENAHNIFFKNNGILENCEPRIKIAEKGTFFAIRICSWLWFVAGLHTCVDSRSIKWFAHLPNNPEFWTFIRFQLHTPQSEVSVAVYVQSWACKKNFLRTKNQMEQCCRRNQVASCDHVV